MINEELLKYKEYLISRGLSLNYFNATRIFIEYLGDKVLSQETITQFFNDNKYSEQSRNLFINAGRNYQIYLGNTVSEWHKIKLLKCPKKQPDYITEKELGQAISYLGNNYYKLINPIKAEALLSFLFFSSVRKGELINLSRKDFDLERCSVKIWGEKTKEERTTYYSKKVQEMLVKYFSTDPEKTNAFNVSLYDMNYLGKLLKACFPQKKMSIHIFRHSGCRFMQRKGIPLVTVRDIMGHKSIQTTMIYSGENEEERRNLYQEKMK